MTVAHTGVVDWLGIEQGTGDIVLTVIDDLDWSDDHGHLLLLQEKLNTYLAFMESDDILEQLVQRTGRTVTRGTPIKVRILAKYPVSEHGAAFVTHAQGVFDRAGFGLSLKIVSASH